MYLRKTKTLSLKKMKRPKNGQSAREFKCLRFNSIWEGCYVMTTTTNEKIRRWSLAQWITACRVGNPPFADCNDEKLLP